MKEYVFKSKKASFKGFLFFIFVIYVILILFGKVYNPLFSKSDVKITSYKLLRVDSGNTILPLNFTVKNPQYKSVNLTINFEFDKDLFEFHSLFYVFNDTKYSLEPNETILFNKLSKIQFNAILVTKNQISRNRGKTFKIYAQTNYKGKKSSKDKIEIYVLN